MDQAVEQATTWRRAVAITKSVLLWTGGVLFLLTAGGHQLQYPGSKAFIGLMVAGLALLPPTRFLVSKVFALTPSRTTAIVLLVGGAGLVMMPMDEANKKELAAKEVRAKQLGFASVVELDAHEAKIEAERQAALAVQAAEAEKKRAEQAERDRVAAAEAERKKEANCKTDLQCWGDKHSIKASFACRPHVERLAKYQFEWTDGWLDSKFSRFKWKDKARGQLTYVGDKIKFQNGFGAWQFAIYTCDYDPLADVVLNVDATPGRMPQ